MSLTKWLYSWLFWFTCDGSIFFFIYQNPSHYRSMVLLDKNIIMYYMYYIILEIANCICHKYSEMNEGTKTTVMKILPAIATYGKVTAIKVFVKTRTWFIMLRRVKSELNYLSLVSANNNCFKKMTLWNSKLFGIR